jgi:hypothetical protein
MANNIGKISAARSVAQMDSFVGEKGMLFYDIVTGNIRISDGVTPGGNAVSLSTATVALGDFVVSANNITTINPNEDINLVSNGTGGLNISGTLHVHPTSSSLSGLEAFSVNAFGEVKIIDGYANQNTAVLNITGNADGTFNSPVLSGVMFQQTGLPGAVSRLYNDGNSNYALFVGRRYNGTSASPTQVLAGQTIVRYGSNGYATGTGFATTGQARMEVIALDNFTSTAQGTAINFYATQSGTTSLLPVLQLSATQSVITGDTLPYADNTYNLGSPTRRFKNVYIGPGTLYITDATLGTLSAITVNNGVFNINGVAQAQLPTILTNTITALSASGTLIIGQVGDTATIQLNRTITFGDATVQSTAGIPLTQKAAASGVATLDATGRLSASQIPSSLSAAIIYKGAWNASSNTPTLSASLPAGVMAGWEYAISVSGTQNIGSGSVTYAQGGFVIYNGSTWDYVAPVSGVTTINGSLTGAVTGIITTSDTGTVTNTMLAGSIANNKLANSSITVTGGTGLGVVGSPVSLGGTITLSNTGVTSIVAGTNVSISSGTGAVTINAVGAVSSVSAGTGVSVSATTGAVTVTNTGVTSAIAGAGINISATTGAVTVTNTGVTSIVAGYGINITSSTGAVTINRYEGVSTPTATGSGANGWTYSLDLGTSTALTFLNVGGNFSGTVTLTGTPVVGRITRLVILGGIKGGTTVTVSGLTAANSSNGNNTFAATSNTASSVVVEFYSSTTALSGVYMNCSGAK